jgi:biotin transport system substrate-specific component
MRIATTLPLWLDASPLRQIGAVVLGSAILTLSSYIEVPMIPVPMTMQTLAVTAIGAMFGWRLGAGAVLVWLTEAAAGLPVLAGDHLGGLLVFAGPTAGYLFAFPLMAALTGWLGSRGWNEKLVPAFVSMLLGNALCLMLGGLWLALLIGPEKAFLYGVAPFALGGIVKSCIAAVGLKLGHDLLTRG